MPNGDELRTRVRRAIRRSRAHPETIPLARATPIQTPDARPEAAPPPESDQVDGEPGADGDAGGIDPVGEGTKPLDAGEHAEISDFSDNLVPEKSRTALDWILRK